ncbi:MAG: hypothetical protein JWQ36_3033 [Enterovirga sp.]|jgi:hypothetical protein|nr:hypothetical protein [Enterovirga sp.]
MIGRILALAIGLFAGLAASQAPEFAQQYRQRIGGAVDELRRVVGSFDDNARTEGLSREEMIARFRGNSDPAVKRDGDDKEQIVDRLRRLERQQAEVATAGPFARLVVLARGFDGQLARATYLDFEPAWPATSEGLVIGGAGFLVGWLGFAALFRAFGRLRPSRWRRQPRQLRSA